jgi:hypothetical protein
MEATLPAVSRSPFTKKIDEIFGLEDEDEEDETDERDQEREDDKE